MICSYGGPGSDTVEYRVTGVDAVPGTSVLFLGELSALLTGFPLMNMAITDDYNGIENITTLRGELQETR